LASGLLFSRWYKNPWEGKEIQRDSLPLAKPLEKKQPMAISGGFLLSAGWQQATTSDIVLVWQCVFNVKFHLLFIAYREVMTLYVKFVCCNLTKIAY
jgi:hypothetical protein